MGFRQSSRLVFPRVVTFTTDMDKFRQKLLLLFVEETLGLRLLCLSNFFQVHPVLQPINL